MTLPKALVTLDSMECGFGWQLVGARGLRLLRWAAGIAAIAAIAGCATVGGGLPPDASPEAKRAAVTERVNARWAALIKGDLDTAYTFLSPASRETVPLAAYKTRARGAGYRTVSVESVECDGGACKVKLMLTYDHRIMKGVVTPLEESWVIDKGQAWYVWRQ